MGVDFSPRLGVVKGGANERPLNTWLVLTESWDFDKMHRRAGGGCAPKEGGSYHAHADAHKYCEGYSCGKRSRTNSPIQTSTRSAKITAWRKAKAQANRAYLEEHVYGNTK